MTELQTFDEVPSDYVAGDGDLHAIIETNHGTIDIRLFEDDAPKTVANFVGLATGKRTWQDPKTGEDKNEPFYDGLSFHRIIDDFMLQGGDPTGTGRGGPGYMFPDEFDNELSHNQPGMLSMANAGPDTNGSQFFITLRPTPHLDNRHAVFGQVVDGMDVVNEIGSVETDGNDRPEDPVVMEEVTIERR